MSYFNYRLHCVQYEIVEQFLFQHLSPSSVSVVFKNYGTLTPNLYQIILRQNKSVKFPLILLQKLEVTRQISSFSHFI